MAKPAEDGGDSTLKSGPVCKKSQGIIYAWAMDAPELILPKDVAFKIGGQTQAKYIVLQVHYASIERFLDGKTTDNSGIVLSGQYEPVKNTAGVYFTATGGHIKANHEEYFDAACEMKEDVEIFPFAYRTHAHKLGLVNSGYVVKQNGGNREEWIEIGRRSPQLPQMFYPATNKVSIRKGDVIATRCTMENTRDHTVYIG
jgi:peptidylglycine monooxygenase